MATLIMISAAGGFMFAQTSNLQAPGAPGADAHWPSAAKNGFGTSNTLRSKVWFTLSEGILTEVFYPTLDTPNVQTLQLIVVTPDGKVETEKEDTYQRIEVGDGTRSLTFQQENRAKSDDYVIRKSYATDPANNSLLVQINFAAFGRDPGSYKLYLYYDPSLNNSGMHDSGWTERGALVASDANKSSALIAAPAFTEMSSGYSGTSDALTQLRKTSTLVSYQRASDGNIVQAGRLATTTSAGRGSLTFTIVLGFGKSPREALETGRRSLVKGFDRVRTDFQAGWHSYVSALPAVDARRQRQFNMCAMVLAALEDKTFRGATIASPSAPWGGGQNGNEPTVSGYHAVWSRDLYQVATAMIALGKLDSANRALEYLLKVQQKPDGSFPQNSWVDGRPIGGGLQMDQVAFVLVLAEQLHRFDKGTWLKHLKPAADFIVRRGPATEQDRWEERPGYSASTIASEITGLVCAARIARQNDDRLSEHAYLKVADEWEENLERWTATTTGPYADRNYYLRISTDDDPNDGAPIEINSGGGTYDERQIVDAGFLELVRLGIRDPKDRLIEKSVDVVDRLLRIETPVGPGWYRYNHDAYGERLDGGPYDGRNGIGRLWTFLTGERGEFELARGNKLAANKLLNTLGRFANDGLMIPEQVWDRSDGASRSFLFGSGTGSATPLAWSMAEFIRLASNIKHGRNLETPQIVADRYRIQRSAAERLSIVRMKQ